MTTTMSQEETLLKLVHGAYGAQNGLNSLLREDWATQCWKYYRAAWTEAAEAVGHITSWLWWKQGQFNQVITPQARRQVHLELVDILHFGLSMDIVESKMFKRQPDEARYIASCCEEYITAFKGFPAISDEACITRLEDLVATLIWKRTFDIHIFGTACMAAGLDLPTLMAWFYGKQALNEFRWANGYNLPKSDPKAYIKHWPMGGKVVEDNEYLADIVETLVNAPNLLESLESGEYKQAITQYLGHHYPVATANFELDFKTAP